MGVAVHADIVSIGALSGVGEISVGGTGEWRRWAGDYVGAVTYSPCRWSYQGIDLIRSGDEQEESYLHRKLCRDAHTAG